MKIEWAKPEGLLDGEPNESAKRIYAPVIRVSEITQFLKRLLEVLEKSQ